MLFVTDSAGNLDQVNAEDVAVWTPSTGTQYVYRDTTGAVPQTEWSYLQTNGTVIAVNPDSITDGIFDFHGGRAATSGGTFITPDVSPGSPFHPVTQRPYAIDNNNALMFIDSSGNQAVDGIGSGRRGDTNSGTDPNSAGCNMGGNPVPDGMSQSGLVTEWAVGGAPCPDTPQPQADPSKFWPSLPSFLLTASPSLGVVLFRGVKAEELEDISQNDLKYRVGRGLEGKYFTETPEQISRFARRMFGNLPDEGPYTLTSGEFEEPLPTPIDLPELGTGNAYFLPDDLFPSGPVTIYDSMSIVP